MIKKILLWTLYAAFVGLLIFGAIYRSKDRLEDTSPERESRPSQSEGSSPSQGSGRGNNSTSENELASPASEPTPLSASAVASTVTESDVETLAGDSEHEWLTLQGVVNSATAQSLVVTLDDGQSLTISRRPWRFAQENGFTTTAGNRIQLIGFYENEAFQAAQLYDLTTDLQVQLRDETGHPLWSSG